MVTPLKCTRKDYSDYSQSDEDMTVYRTPNPPKSVITNKNYLRNESSKLLTLDMERIDEGYGSSKVLSSK
jgi:hypothetical protein